MKLKKNILILVSLIFFTSCSISPPPKPMQIKKGDYTYFKEYMNWFIKEKMKDEDIIGLSVALVDDQTIVWKKGFGYADKEKDIKATEDTIYRAGSITKIFNAMAVMKLAEDKKMDIDKPFKTYLPEFSIKSRFGSTDKITPRNIMTHHSGMPSDWFDRMFSVNPMAYTDYVKVIKNEFVAYPTNTIFSYSNLAITLLGHAVAKTANTPYDKFIKTSFLEPMNMNHSDVKAELEGEGASKSYADGEEAKDEYPLGMLPAGALNTSVSDLANLAKTINNNGKFKNKTILRENTLNEMLKVQNKNVAFDVGSKFGLGFFIDDETFNGLDKIYHHGGATINHRAFFATTQESKLSVIIMSNTKNTDVWEITKEMLVQARKAKTGLKIPKNDMSSKLVKDSNIEGTYATPFGKMDVVKTGNGVYLAEAMDMSIQLTKAKNNKYYGKYMLFGLIPISLDVLKDISVYNKNMNGKTFMIYEKSSRKALLAPKVKPPIIPEIWKNRLGTYHIMDQLEPKDFQIEKVVFKIEDNFPLIEVAFESGDSLKFILDIVNDNEAIKEGIGRGMRETIRFENGIVYGSGLRFKLQK